MKPATQEQVIDVLANGQRRPDARTPSSRAAAIPTRRRRATGSAASRSRRPPRRSRPTAITKVETQLDEQFGIAIDKTDNTQLFDSKSVSASFGRTILIGALYAIIFSIFLIVAYLTFRFEFKYALPTIVALFHDVVITIGVYSLTGRVVTAATVAAVLTVLGYSLYDTIIVFDRVRENTPLLRKNSFAQIVNVSIWETLTRSLNTSLITLFPIATLLVFGGSTLKDFAFALLIGIAAGAYSSIFIAAPLLSLWKGHEAEFRRREAIGIEKATLGTVAPALAGGTGGGVPSRPAAPVDQEGRRRQRDRAGARAQRRGARGPRGRQAQARRAPPQAGPRPRPPHLARSRPLPAKRRSPRRTRSRAGLAEATGGDADAELREAAVEQDARGAVGLSIQACDDRLRRACAARAPGEVLARRSTPRELRGAGARHRRAGIVVELAVGEQEARLPAGGASEAHVQPQRPAAVLGAHRC